MNNPIQNKVNTIFIHVTDLAQSVKWYSDLLGQDYDLNTVQRPVYNLKVDQQVGITLDAGPEGEVKKLGNQSYPLFNFHTDNIDEAYNFIKQLDYDVESEIVRFEDFSYFNLKDPDGNIIMICTG